MGNLLELRDCVTDLDAAAYIARRELEAQGNTKLANKLEKVVDECMDFYVCMFEQSRN